MRKDNILMKYQKLNYSKYQENLKFLLQNSELQAMGIQRQVVGKTTYGYDLDLITVGFGEKELFLVGGTHGSEVIGVDFLLHLLEKLPSLENFDPNTMKIVMMPLQNPEGFDISTNTFSEIPENLFQTKAYEYYLRYRTDSIIVKALMSFQNFVHEKKSAKYFLSVNRLVREFQNFIKKDTEWNRLAEPDGIPEMKIFNQLVLSFEDVKNSIELQRKVIWACDQTIEHLSVTKSSWKFAYFLLQELKRIWIQSDLWEEIDVHSFPRLYQKMFAEVGFHGTWNPDLSLDMEKIYLTYQHPLGSQIGHDATGMGINLNANQTLSPGILARKNDSVVWGPTVKNNIRNYLPGPLGTPTFNKEKFSYTEENLVLEKLLQNSYQTGKFLGCLLFHGTGGLIYYQPYQGLMEENTYLEFYKYNEELASIYQKSTDYKMLSISDTSGYGDYLRRTYPGVLMIELSKMGGNPLGPYGDIQNIYRVFDTNTQALDEILKYFKKQYIRVRKK